MNVGCLWGRARESKVKKNTKGLSYRFRVVVAVMLVSLTPVIGAYAGDITVGSWNIERLGHGGHKSYPALAAIASKVDLLAVQEVMTEEGVELLEKELEKRTGEPWGRLVSHAVGSRSYKEMYAFLWRESSVEYTEGAVVYLDRSNHFIREPFSAKFRSKRDGSELALSTVHILYGKSIKDRTPEIKALEEYWLWLGEVYPNVPRVLVGDFNLPPGHGAWGPLRKYAMPLITSGATTLSQKPGKFANLYDNIWVERETSLPIAQAGIINYPKLIGWNHKKSRKHVSDHAPVYMTLGAARLGDEYIEPLPTPESNKRQQTHQNTSGSQGKIKGNKNSMIYHRSDCPSYSKVGESNAVFFDSPSVAVRAGYREAKNCP